MNEDQVGLAASLDAIVALVEQRAPDFALLQRGVDMRRFAAWAVAARAQQMRTGATMAEAIRLSTPDGPEGFHLPGNEGRIRRGGKPTAEITPDLSVREQRELLAYIGLFRDTDPGGRPRTDEGEWLRRALVARDQLRAARPLKNRRGDITEEDLAEKLAIEVRSLQRSFKRCGVSFGGFLKLPS